MLFRRVFNIQPQLNLKGLALIAHSYLNLYHYESENPHWLAMAEDCLEFFTLIVYCLQVICAGVTHLIGTVV